MRAVVPAAATTGKISITNAGGTGQSASDYIVVEVPVVTSFLPATAWAGMEVTITGDKFQQVSSVTFNGTPAANVTVDSQTQIRATVPGGAATGVIGVTNPAGTGTSSNQITIIDPPQVHTFIPTDDAYVRSSLPTNNYGSSTELLVRKTSTADHYAYLKFNVTGLGGVVHSAKLRLKVTDDSPDGGGIYSVSNNYLGTVTPWVESGLIWDNAPGISGSPLSSLGAVALGATVEFDVKAAIIGDGVYSFGIKNNSSDALKYSSEESSTDPQLIIEVFPSTVPTISSFTPGSGAAGAEVTIMGTNFLGATAVNFNGAPAANYIVVSSTQIRATVPVGATTGKITVTSSAGTGQSANGFTVIQPPSISSFSPISGAVGTQVTINGTSFSSATAVKFNGVSASGFTIVSSTEIRANVPPGASSGPISVTNAAGSVTSASNFTVLFPPIVSSFTPASGVVGTEVTINGSFFSAAIEVKFNGTLAPGFNIVSETEIRATVPAGAATGKISVTNADGTGTSASDFTVIQTATISSFTPDIGPPSTEVTITGSHFTGTTDVQFNGSSVSAFTVSFDTQIRATAPAGAATGPISVTNPAGTGTSGSNFTVTSPPSTLTYNPTADSYIRDAYPTNNYGTTTTLRVRNTGSFHNIYLKFNVTGIVGTIQSAKLRLFVSDAGPDGGSIYSVSNNYLGTINPWLESGINWNNAPSITGAPLSSAGAVTLGQTVELDVSAAISGDGTYSFGIKNNNSDLVYYDSKETVNKPQLVIDMLSSPVPTISSFTPTSGAIGSSVTISGNNFIGATSVNFNGTSASFSVDANSQITATVPVGATTGKISVTNADGTGQSVSDFTVLLPPTISSFTPTSGPAATSVTITGANFSGATSVQFNGTSAASFTVDSAAQIRATVPAAATSGPISVTNAIGIGASSSDFTVTFTPSITSFTPTGGLAGTEVTINGFNFSGTNSVAFNGAPASGFTEVSDTEVRATVPAGATTGKISVTTAVGTGLSASDFAVSSGAVTFEEIQTGASAGINSVTTFSNLTAVSGHLYLAAISGKSNIAVTGVSGLGLTWTLVKAQCAARGQTRVEVWKAQGTPSGGGTVAATFASAPLNAVIAVSRYSGVDANAIGSVVSANTKGSEGACSGGADNSSYSVNITTTVANAVVFGAAAMRVRTHTPGAGYIERAELVQGTSGSGAGIAVVDRTVSAAAAVVLNGTFDSAVDWAVVGLELRPQGSVAKLAAGPVEDSDSSDGEEILTAALPEEFELYPNYPNPFNLETTIEYALPVAAKVRMVIYNLKGQQVRQLVDEPQSAGVKRVRWDGRNDAGNEIGSGVYFVRLNVNQKIFTRKITLQK